MALRGWGAEPLFLGHFWSLAVEEQFYLIWPFLVMRLSQKRLLPVAVAGIAVAFFLRVVLIKQFTYESAYVLLPARMDALLVGACIALWARGGRVPRWVTSVSLRAVVGLAFLVAVVGNNIPLPGFWGVITAAGHFSITSAAFGLLVIEAQANRDSLVCRIFSVGPARFLGKYSYAIYVFHLAVIVGSPALIKYSSRRLFGHVILPNVVSFGVIVAALTVLLALISWHLIESPFLRLKDSVQFGEAAPRVR